MVVKNLPANAGDKRDVSTIPGAGRSPGVGHSNPLQHSWLSTHQWKKKMLPVVSVNKRYCSLRVNLTDHPDGEPWGDSRFKQDACHIAVNHWSHPDHKPWGESGWKSRGRWPQTAEVPVKGMILVSASSCIFSYIEKCQITWDVWFSLITVIFWYSDYLVFVAKNPIYPSPSLSSWDQSLRDIWESMCWA